MGIITFSSNLSHESGGTALFLRLSADIVSFPGILLFHKLPFQLYPLLGLYESTLYLVAC